MSQPSSRPVPRHPRSCARCTSPTGSSCCRRVPRPRRWGPRWWVRRATPHTTQRKHWSMAEIVIVEDKAAAGALVADHIAQLVRSNPETVLGLATGSTPLPVYEALRSRLEGVDLSRVRGFAL